MSAAWVSRRLHRIAFLGGALRAGYRPAEVGSGRRWHHRRLKRGQDTSSLRKNLLYLLWWKQKIEKNGGSHDSR